MAVGQKSRSKKAGTVAAAGRSTPKSAKHGTRYTAAQAKGFGHVRTGETLADLDAAADRLLDQADSADVTRLSETYHLKRSDLSRLTGFSVRALADWSAGDIPSEPARRRLQEIRRLLDALAEIVEVKAIPAWLQTRNKVLDDMTPLQTIEVGEIDRLWGMVYRMGGGYRD
jgi:DNA-binding transcriptional regulator YiaG